jgi:hypothetical protein
VNSVVRDWTTECTERETDSVDSVNSVMRDWTTESTEITERETDSVDSVVRDWNAIFPLIKPKTERILTDYRG